MKTTTLLIAAMLTTGTVQADGFMDADTHRARTTEANGECDGQNMQPIEQLPGGGVYRDNVGGANNGN